MEDIEFNYPRLGPLKGKDSLFNNFGNKVPSFNYFSIGGNNPFDIPKCTIYSIDIFKNVILIETKNGSYAIRGLIRPALQSFNYFLLKTLNIETPNSWIVHFNLKLFRQIIFKIEGTASYDKTTLEKVNKILKNPYWIISEYIGGYRVKNFTSISYFEKLNTDNIKLYRDRLVSKLFNQYYTEGRIRFVQMGIFYIFEIYLSFNLTIPLYEFDNNLDNEKWIFMDEKENNSKFLSLINSQVIGEKEDYFYEKIEDFLILVFEDLNKICEAKIDPTLEYYFEGMEINLTSCKNFIKYYKEILGLEVNLIAQFNYIIGLIIGINRILLLGYPMIIYLIKKLKVVVKNDYKNIWNIDINNIDILHYEKLLKLFKSFSDKNEKNINYINNITLEVFKIKINNDKITKSFDEIFGLNKKENDDKDIKNIENQINNEIKEKEEKELEKSEINNENLKTNNEQLNNKIKEIFDIDMSEIHESNNENNNNEDKNVTIQSINKNLI